MDKIPRNNQESYGNFRSSSLPFLLHGMGGVNLFKYLWNPASFFTLRKCKQTTVVTAERDKVVIISSNTAAVATCPRNSGLDCDSLSTVPEETWSSCSLFSASPEWCHNCLTTNLTVRVMVHPNPMFSNIFVCSQGDKMIGVKMCSLLYLDVLYEHTSIFNSQSLE